MILADTSAWVEYDRATGSAVDQRLTELIRDEGPLAVTGSAMGTPAPLARSTRKSCRNVSWVMFAKCPPISSRVKRLNG